MNGDLGKLYHRQEKILKILTTVVVTEELHHKENRKDVDLLFENDRNRLCKTHQASLKYMWIAIVGACSCIGALAAWVAKLHI